MTTDVAGYTPTFSPKARTLAYVTCLLITVLALLALGLLALFDVITLLVAAAALGLVTTACALVASGFGVAYRPTRIPGS